MKDAQPIRDRLDIDRLRQAMKGANATRDRALLSVALNTGLRIGDILRLTVGDVAVPKTHIVIVQQKTGKPSRNLITPALRAVLDPYIAGKDPGAPLFPSSRNPALAIDRVQAYRLLETARKRAGLENPISPHSLRKTFGWHHYNTYKDVVLLQKIFHHSAPSVTLRYIGVDADSIDASLKDFSL